MLTPEDEFKRWLQSSVDELIRKNLADPDLAGQSPDYRAGYEQGCREIFAMLIMALRKA